MSVAAPVSPAAGAPQVRGLSCPSCGGVLSVELGLRVAVCPYCQKTLLAVGEVGVRRLAVEPEVNAARARETARRWLGKGWSKDPKLRREAEIGEAFLCFLPFYRITADVVGYVLGQEKRTRTVNKRTEVYYVDVELRVEQSFDRTVPGLNVAEWGIERVDLQGDVLVPFDEERLARLGMVFPPTGSELEALSRAVAEFSDAADPSGRLHSVRFKFLEALRQRLAVIYYPLWVVRYRYRNRSYQVLVDAQDGTVAYGKAPGNDVYRAAMLVLSQAAAGFVGTTGARLALSADDGAIALLLISGAIATAILFWGWRKFRWGGVVIEGSGAPSGLSQTFGAALAGPMRLAGARAGSLSSALAEARRAMANPEDRR
jgi:hypothetical protein